MDALNARAALPNASAASNRRSRKAGLNLVEARHPLLVTSGREVVPIDLRMSADQHGIVISGPNTGGKTVALKTLGLIALMAQTGILVPAARGCKLPVFRCIFADIGDSQSIEASLSSFAAHIVEHDRDSSSRSRSRPWSILDEPGGGTDPVEGAALAIALMDYLGGRECVVAVATHSTAVKLHAYSRARFEAAAVDFDPERLVPLYRLKPHTIGQSYGLAVARRLGLPEEITLGAEQALPAGASELAEALRRLEEERGRLKLQLEKLRDCEIQLVEREREALAAADQAHERAATERQRCAKRAHSCWKRCAGRVRPSSPKSGAGPKASAI